MPVTLTVSQVRDALYMGDRVSNSAGAKPTTAMLGRWFHDGMRFLVSNDSPESPLAALLKTESDLEIWKEELVRRAYEQFVGPKLTRHCVALQESVSQVAAFWQAMRAACHWFAELSWTLQTGSGIRRPNVAAPWRGLAESIQTDAAIECELKDPEWSDSVRLVGIADAIIRLASTGVWCVVEFKTGRTSPEADLGQACLYHMVLSEIEQSKNGQQADPGTLALISFTPERQETLFAAEELTVARQRLRELIGRLAGVSGSNVPSTSPKSPAGNLSVQDRKSVV